MILSNRRTKLSNSLHSTSNAEALNLCIQAKYVPRTIDLLKIEINVWLWYLVVIICCCGMFVFCCHDNDVAAVASAADADDSSALNHKRQFRLNRAEKQHQSREEQSKATKLICYKHFIAN